MRLPFRVRLTLAAVLLAGLACSSSEPAAAPPPGETADTSGYIISRGTELMDVALAGTRRTVHSFSDGSIIFDPSLSPDGKRIAFIRQEPVKNIPGGDIDFGSDLYVINRDGSDLRELAHHRDLAEYMAAPSWLDDGHLLFAIRGRNGQGFADHRIERIELSSGTRTRVLADAVDPSVGPDRRQMVFIAADTLVTREGVFLASVDGSGLKPLLPPGATLTRFGSPVISPDGTKVAFAAGDPTGARAAPGGPSAAPAALHPFFQDVWLVNADGSGLYRLAEVIETGLSLSWTPDGRWLYALGGGAFRRIDPASGQVEVIGPGALGGIFFYSGR